MIILISSAALAACAAGLLLAWNLAKQRAELHGCGNYMVSITMAGRMWANDNGDRFPPDLVSMSNELVSPKILICPGDPLRRRAVNWDCLTPEQSSFEVVTASIADGSTNAVFLRCKVHGSVSYGDGSAFVRGRRHRKH